MSEGVILIIAMMAVTYIPRLLPFVFLDSERLHPKVRLFLRAIPFAALGALILPGGITAVENSIPVSVAGLVVAALAAIKSRNLLLSVFASVLVVALLLYLRDKGFFFIG